MALPSAVARQQGQIAMHGIRFTMAPLVDIVDAHLYEVEIQRAPDSAGAPNTGSAEVIQRIGPIARNGTPYTDYLPNDAVRRHYRWRHVRVGYAAGAWSEWLRTPPSTGTQGAKPVALPIVTPKPDATQIVGELVFSAAAPPSVGGPAGASTIQRRIRIPATRLRNDSTNLSHGIGTVVPAASATTVTCDADIELADGATVVSVSARLVRKNSADIAKVEWYRVSDAGTSTLIATTEATSTSASPQTITDTPTELVASTQYVVRCTLRGDATNNDATAIWLEVLCTVPDLGVGR